jgi:hypothetical protein
MKFRFAYKYFYLVELHSLHQMQGVVVNINNGQLGFFTINYGTGLT